MPTPLTPAEKVTLARDHKVGPWFIEGIASLTSALELSPDVLEEAVGLRTAFRISTIRLRLCAGVAFATLRLPNGAFTGLRIADLRYGCCWKTFPKDKTMLCHSCSQEVPASEVGRIYLNLAPTLYTSSWNSHFKFTVQDIFCSSCNQRFITQTTTCLNRNVQHAAGPLYIFLASYSGDPKLASDKLIREFFKDEINEYAGH